MSLPAAAFRAAIVAAPGAALGFLTAQDTFWVAIFAIAAVLALPLTLRVLGRRRIDPLEPLWPFLVCYAITYAFKPILDRAGFVTYAWFRLEEETAIAAVFVAAACLLLVYCGYFSGAYRAVVKILPAVDSDPGDGRARLAALVLVAGGAAALAVVSRVTGVSFDPSDAIAGSYRTTVLGSAYGRGYLVVLCSLTAFAPGLQLLVALRTRSLVDWLLFGGVLAMVLAVLTVLYSRQLMLQMGVILLVIAYFRTRWIGAKSIVAAGVAILLIGGFMGLRLRQERSSPLQAAAFLGHTFESFEFLAAGLPRLPIAGLLGGQSFVEDLLFTYVPRRLFPEKPDVFGIVRIQNLVAPELAEFEVSRATFPPGFLTEGYANFGIVGLILISLAYGTGLRLAGEWFWPRRERLFPLLVYSGLVLNMTNLFRSAAQFVLQVLVYSAVLYLLLHARLPLGHRAGAVPRD